MGPGRGCRACLSFCPQRKGLFPGGAAPSTASRQAGCLAPVPSARKVWFPALALQLLFPFTRRVSRQAAQSLPSLATTKFENILFYHNQKK